MTLSRVSINTRGGANLGAGIFLTHSRASLHMNNIYTHDDDLCIAILKLKVMGTFQPNFHFFFSDTCKVKMFDGRVFWGKVFANKKMSQPISSFNFKHPPFSTTLRLQLEKGTPFDALIDAVIELEANFFPNDGLFLATSKLSSSLISM